MNSTQWAELWRELASHDLMTGTKGETGMIERWRRVARQLDAGERAGSDPLLEHILARLAPDSTVLDIGAGIGRWTLPIARHARRVTAVEPLSDMQEVLVERAASHGIANLEVVRVPWLEARVPPHDVVVAAHSTYTTPDLIAFVRKMDASALRTCYLALRVPAHDGVIGELSARLRGRWHDSPNFIVGYNLLLAAGFYPNVLMEPQPLRFWTDATLNDAVARAIRHLQIEGEEYDEAAREVLSRRLVLEDGAYRWPDGMRSALVWWNKS